MRTQYFYNAMAMAFDDLEHSDPIYREFLVVETNTSFVSGHYTIVSRSHLNNVQWVGTQPKVLYSTDEGSFSRLLKL